jgi:hypothetical protein
MRSSTMANGTRCVLWVRPQKSGVFALSVLPAEARPSTLRSSASRVESVLTGHEAEVFQAPSGVRVLLLEAATLGR